MWLGKYLTFYSLLVSVRTSYPLENPAESSKSRSKRLLNYNIICPSGCVTCSPVSGCVTCMSGLYLILHRDGIRQTGMCVRECPKSYYGIQHRTYNRCYKCNLHNCDSCVSSTYCIQCTSPYIAHKGKCVNKCPDGLFYETYTQSCLPKVDCAVAEWDDWGTCTKNGQHCGYKYGIQKRSRSAIQNPSPNGLACPALNEYKQCKLKYRFCSDILNNNSDLAPTTFYHKKKYRNDNNTSKNSINKQYLKQKKRERRRRKRCKSKSRIWRRGVCLKKRKRPRNQHQLQNIRLPDMSRNLIDYEIINKGRKISTNSYHEWLTSMDNNVKL